MESILDLSPAHQAVPHGDDAAVDAEERVLQQHMAAAAQLPLPTMSQAAAAMLQQYFLVRPMM